MSINQYYVVSVMSGTSLDGIDIVYSKYEYTKQWHFKILKNETVSYPSKWKKTLGHLIDKTKSQLNSVDEQYSRYLGNQILYFIKKTILPK